MPVLGELELAWRLLPNRFVAVTGTNGKTTTTELLGAIWREAGLPVAVAGNVGTPLSSLVGELEPEATVVCEVSSFQAEDCEAFAPDTALLLNLEEDHLDRHGSFEAYREAKLRLFAQPDARAGGGGAAGRGGAGRARRARSEFGELPLPAEEIRLRGAHNLENAMGAAAAAIASGVPGGGGGGALRSFAGVPHRLEEVGTVGGVLYVNDSKATNVASALRGIEAFDGGVHAILGGSLKGGGFEGLRERGARAAWRRYLIGEAAERLEQDLAGTVPLHRCGDLATRRARAPRRPRSRARWCCSRRPAPASTSSATTRSAASASRVARPAGMNPGWRRRKRSGCRREAPGRVLDPLHRHALPARGRRGDGLLGELGGVAPVGAGRPVLLPEALRAVRPDRAGAAALRLAARAQGRPRRSRRCCWSSRSA